MHTFFTLIFAENRIGFLQKLGYIKTGRENAGITFPPSGNLDYIIANTQVCFFMFYEC